MHLTEAIIAAGFEPDAYAKAHADLAHLDADALIQHYIRHGVGERRLLPMRQLNLDALLHIDDFEVFTSLTFAYAVSSGRSGLSIAPAARDLLGIGNLGCTPFVLIGDSHSERYCRGGSRDGDWLAPIHIFCQAGSAAGLNNPNSRSGYGAMIKARVAELHEAGISIPIIVQFGQVDTEFVSIFRRVRSGANAFSRVEAEAFNIASIEAYTNFLREAFPEAMRSKVSIASIFPPSLSDQKWAEGYLNGHIMSLEAVDPNEMAARVRDLEVPSLKQRTELHRHYNAHLEQRVRRDGFNFMDGFTPLIGADGLLDTRWSAITQGSDHHVDHLPSTVPMEAILWSVLKR